MNKIINKFLLARDKCMCKLHLRWPGFTHSACRLFTKHHEGIKKFRETGNLKHLYRNKFDKACLAHDAAYSDSKDLAERTISDKVLKDRAHEIARNPNDDGYQRGLASMMHKFFNKKSGSGAKASVNNCYQRGLASMMYKFFDKKTGLGAKASVNKDLAEELHKPVIKKSKRKRV